MEELYIHRYLHFCVIHCLNNLDDNLFAQGYVSISLGGYHQAKSLHNVGVLTLVKFKHIRSTNQNRLRKSVDISQYQHGDVEVDPEKLSELFLNPKT